MMRNLVDWLKVLIVILIVFAVGAQGLVPVAAGQTADANPAFAYLALPYSVVLIAIIACGEVVAVATWKLLTHVGDESIFTPDAFRWVNVIIYGGVAATVLSAGWAVHEFAFVGAGPITVPMGLIGLTVGICAFTLLMLVMRGLLRSAVARHAQRSRRGHLMPIVVNINVLLAKRGNVSRGVRLHGRPERRQRRRAEERTSQGRAVFNPGCHLPSAGLPTR